MAGVKIGDVVHGYGYRHERECLMHVDKINYFPGSDVISGVSGRVVGESGKMSTTQETILSFDQRREGNLDYSRPGQDVFEAISNMPVEKRGKWVVIPDFEILGSPATLASRIKDLAVDESFEIDKSDNSINSCRTSASLIGDQTGNIYRVSKTEAGCTITRKA